MLYLKLKLKLILFIKIFGKYLKKDYQKKKYILFQKNLLVKMKLIGKIKLLNF